MNAVEYNDQDNKTRWGYLSAESYKLLDRYRNDMIGNAEDTVIVYLADGTTGRAQLQHLNIIHFEEPDA